MCCTSTFWKCVWFENMGSITKVLSVEVENITRRFCPFFHLKLSDGVSEESLPISTLSYAREVSCSPSAFYALPHSLSKCWHVFCYARGPPDKWRLSRSFYAGPAKWRENNGTKMISHPRKTFPVRISETKWVRISPPCFSILIAADLSQKKMILSSFSIFRDP